MFTSAQAVLRNAVAARAFPGAVAEVGSTTNILWREAFGSLTFADEAPPAIPDTVFDLASLTKVLATTSLLMQQVERGTLALDDRVADRLPRWRGDDRSEVTVRSLLAHCSGLPAYLPLYRDHEGREAFEQAICALPLEYEPRRKSVYSDLGFILLGFILEDIGGLRLDARFDALLRQMGIVDRLRYTPPAQWMKDIAPTEIDPWRGRLLIGEVHDENCAALGGVAAHAGLFGRVGPVGEYARHLLQVLAGRSGAIARETLTVFVTRQADVPQSSRALGWDTMLPTSSCGTRLSARAFGHTGFTGTSLWIDPDREVYVVLLTNRVYPSRENNAITEVRPAFHDAVIGDLSRAG